MNYMICDVLNYFETVLWGKLRKMSFYLFTLLYVKLLSDSTRWLLCYLVIGK